MLEIPGHHNIGTNDCGVGHMEGIVGILFRNDSCMKIGILEPIGLFLYAKAFTGCSKRSFQQILNLLRGFD